MLKGIRKFFFPGSIGARLFRIIVAVYLVVATGVTSALIIEEFISAKRDVIHTITIYEKSIAATLADALWNMEREDLACLAEGMLGLPEIWGVKIVDPLSGNRIIDAGCIRNTDRPVTGPEPSGRWLCKTPFPFMFELFHLEFPIYYAHQTGSDLLGIISIYSNTLVIFKRVKFRIILILSGALIKALTVWFAFLFFNRCLLSAPLSEFVRAVERMDLGNLGKFHINLKIKRKNELTDLQDAFNAMLQRLKAEAHEKSRYAESLKASNIELEQLKKDLEERVRERTRQLEAKNHALELLSITDQLTNLFNRRYLDETLKHEIQRSARYEMTLSLILLDLDHFKAVNDSHGHDSGDQVLISVAEILRDNTRQTDIVGRWGGEEFLILATGTSLSEARIVAEKLRIALADKRHDDAGRVTASFGVVECHSDDTASTLVKRADKSLYKAKSQGRNRVVAG